jgi:hypothetical protein
MGTQSDPPPSSTPDNTSSSEYRRELSCTTIVDSSIENSTTPFVSSLLDSGTMSHLVTSRKYFLDFRMEDNPGIQTANHGMLCTTGRGMCVAELVLGKDKYRITLHNCFHAPNALVNLLSVRCMLEKSWDCEFKGSHNGVASHCQLLYNGDILGTLPLTRNLCHMDLRFIHPAELASGPPFAKEISVVAMSTATLDLWHARMGHLGGESVKQLPLTATGIRIDHTKPLSRCEACVTLGLRREQFVACTRSVARGHERRGRDKAQVVGDNKAFGVLDKSTLTGLGELKLLAD